MNFERANWIALASFLGLLLFVSMHVADKRREQQCPDFKSVVYIPCAYPEWQDDARTLEEAEERVALRDKFMRMCGEQRHLEMRSK